VIAQIVAACRAYRIEKVTGDSYAGGFSREQFEKNGMAYEKCDRNRSQLYLDFLPLVTSGSADLLDDPRMVAQFAALERRTAKGGRDSVDHKPGAHDDLCTAVAGALVAVGASDAPQYRVRSF
jgi:hypothetical protein